MSNTDIPAPVVYNLGANGQSIRNMTAGPSAFDGWREIMVDVTENSQPDILSDLREIDSHVPAGEAAMVFASHVLEHLWDHEVNGVLSSMLRMLAPDGVALIRVPDLARVAAVIAAPPPGGGLYATLYRSSAGDITPMDVLFGYQRWIQEGQTYMAHKSGFTVESMLSRLKHVGFNHALVVTGPAYELCIAASVQPIEVTPQLKGIFVHCNPRYKPQAADPEPAV